jgi:hypothetical protein
MITASAKARFFLVCGLIAVLAIVAFLYKGGGVSPLAAGRPSLPCRRGESVQNLRTILRALQQYQAAHGGTTVAELSGGFARMEESGPSTLRSWGFLEPLPSAARGGRLLDEGKRRPVAKQGTA